MPHFVANLPHLMSVQRVDLSLRVQIRRMLQEAENVDDLPLGFVAQQLNCSEDTVRRDGALESVSTEHGGTTWPGRGVVTLYRRGSP